MAPVIGSAKTTTSGAVSVSESYSFTLSALSDVSIGYAWSDLLLVKNAKVTEYNAASLGWTLTGASAQSGSFADVSSQLSGRDTLSLSGLAAGTYALNLTGQWAGVSYIGNAWTYVAPP